MSQAIESMTLALPGRKSEVRQRQITERVVAEGSCTAQELANEFGVSIMTRPLPSRCCVSCRHRTVDASQMQLGTRLRSSAALTPK